MMTVDFVALGRYRNGQASQEERAAVEAWLGADAERRAAVAALQAVWAADVRYSQAPYDTDAAWRRLRRGVARTARPAKSVASRWRPPAVAAGLVVLLGIGGVWWLGAHPVARPPALREYATPKGRRAVFRLLDGTEITLNADSRPGVPVRSEERRVGKEWRSRWSPYHLKKKIVCFREQPRIVLNHLNIHIANISSLSQTSDVTTALAFAISSDIYQCSLTYTTSLTRAVILS